MRRALVGAFCAFVVTSCGGGEELPQPVAPPPPPVVGPPPPPAEPPPKPPIADLEKAALVSAAMALNAHDAAKVASAYAEDAVIRVAGLSEVDGRAAAQANMQEWFDTFAGIRVGFRRVWMLGDVVVAEWVLNGTYTGDFFGEKGQNQPIGHVGLSILWFDETGHVREEHRYGDLGTVAQQVLPKGAKAVQVVPPPMPIIPAAPEILVAKAGDAGPSRLELGKTLYDSIELKDEKEFLGKLTDDVTYEGHLGQVSGKAEAKVFFETLTKAFPDLKFKVTNAWGMGDTAIVEYTLSGTHQGAILGLQPTHHAISVHAVDILRLSGDKIARASTYSNGLEIMTQLGAFKLDKPVVPPPGLKK
jgi:predicted ester cyclase